MAGALGLLVAGLGGPPAWAQETEERVVRIDTLNVRDTLYHLTGGGGNGLALIDEINGGVVLIDTKPRGWGAATLEAVAGVTDLPVTTIINTHAHPEHAGSNREFETATEIVMHERTAAYLRDLEGYGPDGSGLATTTVTERHTLLEDLDQIDLYHFGAGHTDGDLVVVFPQKGVAYLGGLFPDTVPPDIDLERGGSALALPDTLTRTLEGIEGVTRVITGHGPFPTTYAGRGRRERGADRAWTGWMTWDDLAGYRDFVTELNAQTTAAHEAGRSVDEAVADLALPERFAAYDLTGVRATIETIYQELAEQP